MPTQHANTARASLPHATPSPPDLSHHTLLGWWLLPFLVLPWLSPFTAGPLSNFWPLLLSAFCAVVLWLFCRHLSARQVTAGWLIAAVVGASIALAEPHERRARAAIKFIAF